MTGEAMNERPIGGKYSGYADASRSLHAPILTTFNDVLHLPIWSANVSLKWDFFPPPDCARWYFAAPTNLNCLLLTFRCFISSLACNHQSIWSCNKEFRTLYADTGLNDVWISISLHQTAVQRGYYITEWKVTKSENFNFYLHKILFYFLT